MHSFEAVAKAIRKKPAYIDVPVPKEAKNIVSVAPKHEPVFIRSFAKLARSLVDDETRKRVIAALDDPYATIEDVVNQFDWFNPLDEIVSKKWELYSQSLFRAYEGAMEDAGNAALRDINLSHKVRFRVQKTVKIMPNPFSTKWVEKQAGNLIVNINDTQKQTVRELVLGGLQKGYRSTDLMDEISQTVGLTPRQAQAVLRRKAKILEETGSEALSEQAGDAYSEKLLLARGRAIARTETKEAICQGQLDAWQGAKDEGLLPDGTLKDWVEMPESPRLSDICRELGAMDPIPLNEAFQSSIVGPVQRPPAHPNCRSVLVLRFPE